MEGHHRTVVVVEEGRRERCQLQKGKTQNARQQHQFITAPCTGKGKHIFVLIGVIYSASITFDSQKGTRKLVSDKSSVLIGREPL